MKAFTRKLPLIALLASGTWLAGCGSLAGPAEATTHPDRLVTRIPGYEPTEETPQYARFPAPYEITRDFVIADAFIDEDQRPWRAEMYKRFAPVMKRCATRREAIVAIAKAASEVCGVKYSTERRAANQCVEESLKSGKASCTGLSILLAAAYRSVGIPARLAQVAEWGDRPGNHTWVEVWDDDGWHFIEYYPDAKGVDHGWILDPIAALDPANPLSRVVAADPRGAEVYFLPWNETRRDIRGVDRTAWYQKLAGGAKTKAGAETGVVSIVANDRNGARVATDFMILDGEKPVSAGRTPGPLDDMNNTPRRTLRTDRDHTVKFETATSGTKTVVVRAVSGKTTEVVLPTE